MPVGKCQEEFRLAAMGDGIELGKQSVPWLNERGHFGVAEESQQEAGNRSDLFDIAMSCLRSIYSELGGDAEVLSAGRRNRLRGDFEHASSRSLVEIDEFQHFTSFRCRTIEMYPASFPLGFDRERYVETCNRLCERADRYRRAKWARGFGDEGRQRQRAYYDALRDLATPAVGRPPLIRIAALEDDGFAAYRDYREELYRRLGLGEPI